MHVCSYANRLTAIHNVASSNWCKVSQTLLLTSRSGSRVGQNTQAMVPKITDLTITVMGIQVALTGFKAFMHSHDMLYREGRS